MVKTGSPSAACDQTNYSSTVLVTGGSVSGDGAAYDGYGGGMGLEVTGIGFNIHPSAALAESNCQRYA